MTLSEYPCSAILASLGVQVVLISAYLSHEKIELSLDIVEAEAEYDIVKTFSDRGGWRGFGG